MTIKIDPPVNFSTDLSGRIALVTGASSGLGLRFAKVLAACGAKVAVTARRKERLDALADEIAAAGGHALAVELDVSRSSAFAPALDMIEAELGPVDILVNNAGVPAAGYATRMSPEQIDDAFDTNLRGPWVLSCEMARRTIAREKPGWIVNIASIGAFSFSGNSANSLYTVTKTGLVRMTEVHAKEWAKFDINVNAIAPGTISSEMVDGLIERKGDSFLQTYPRKRMGNPDDLDSTLLYLVSPASRFVTGTCIKVDDAQLPR